MREAQRSYDANVNVIGATRAMIARTLDILRFLRLRPAMPTPGIAANAYSPGFPPHLGERGP